MEIGAGDWKRINRVCLLVLAFLVMCFAAVWVFGPILIPTVEQRMESAEAHWRRHSQEYKRFRSVLKTPSEEVSRISLPPELRHLSKPGKAFIERFDSGLATIFILEEYGFDNSIAIAHFEGDFEPVEGSRVLEKIDSKQELEPNWYLVGGT